MAAAQVLSAAARERPIVVAIEDLHWSEAVLRDVLSQIVDDGDAPIVIACTARPELFDQDPSWGGGRANSTTIRLMPLSDKETATLVEVLLTSVIKNEAERQRGAHERRREPFVRGGVRADAAGTAPRRHGGADVGAGGDRRAARLGRARAPRHAAGRRGRRRALLARASWRWWASVDADGVRGALAELTRRGLVVRSSVVVVPGAAGVRVRPRADPRGRVLAAAADGARDQARRGRDVARVGRRRSSRRLPRRAGAALRTGGAAGRRVRRARGRRTRGASARPRACSRPGG